MKLIKDTLKPGLYNERGRMVVVTKDDVTKIHDSVKTLHDNGYKIPFWMEHVPRDDRLSFPIKATDSELLSQAEGDPWFGGWVTGMNLDSNDLLHTEIDVPDHLGSRLAGSGTFVSPQFGEWDEIKAKAPIALLHLAATRNPVNRDQTKRFVEKKSASGLDSSGTSDQTASDDQQLSLLDAIGSGIKTFSFSLSDAVGNLPNSGGQQPQAGGQQQQPGQPGMQSQTQTDPAADLKTKLQQALQALGVTLDPNSAIHDNPKILTSLLSAIANAEGEAVETSHENPSGTPGGNDPYNEHSTVIAMSQTATTTPTAPVTPAPTVPAPAVQPVVPNPLEAQLREQGDKIHTMSQALVIQDQVTKNLMSLVTIERQAKYNDRIAKALANGQCTPAVADSLKTMSGVYQFSMNQSPDQKAELDIRLEVIEGMPHGAAWDVNQRMQAEQVQTHQFGSNGLSTFSAGTEPSEERADAVVAELFKLSRSGFVAPQEPALNRQ